MSKKITELDQPPISTEEFEIWKKNWDTESPIPDQIHDYMKRVAIHRLEKSLDVVDSVLKNIT